MLIAVKSYNPHTMKPPCVASNCWFGNALVRLQTVHSTKRSQRHRSEVFHGSALSRHSFYHLSNGSRVDDVPKVQAVSSNESNTPSEPKTDVIEFHLIDFQSREEEFHDYQSIATLKASTWLYGDVSGKFHKEYETGAGKYLNDAYLGDFIFAKSVFRLLLPHEISWLFRVLMAHIPHRIPPLLKNTDHKVWKYIEESFVSAASEFDDIDFLLIADWVCNGQVKFPKPLVNRIMSCLESRLSNDHETAMEYLYTYSPYTDHYNANICAPSVMQCAYSAILLNSKEIPPRDFIMLMKKVIFMKPAPPEELVNIFYDRATDYVLKFEDPDGFIMREFLDVVLHLSPAPSPIFQDKIVLEFLKHLNMDSANPEQFHMEIEHVLEVACILPKLVACCSAGKIVTKDADKKCVNSIIMSMPVYIDYVVELIPVYQNFGGSEYNSVIDKLCQEYFKSTKKGTLRTVNAVFEMLKQLDKASTTNLDHLFNWAKPMIKNSSASELVFLLSLMAKTNKYDPILETALEKLVKESLTTSQLFRVVCTCAKFRKQLHSDRKFVLDKMSEGLNPNDLQEAELEHLVLFADALMKERYHNKQTAEVLLSNIFRKQDEMTLRHAIQSMKACHEIGGQKVVLPYIDKLYERLQSSVSTISSLDISYVLEFFVMLDTQIDDKSMKLAFTLISALQNKFDGEQLGRLFRWIGRSGCSDDNLFKVLLTRAVNTAASLSAEDACWVLWSSAKKGYKLSRSQFNKLKQPISPKLMELDVHSLARYMFSCASFMHYAPQELNQVAARFDESSLKEFGFNAIASIAWAFSRLNYRNNIFLEWLQRHIVSHSIKGSNFQSLSNIIWTFLHFEVKPDTEFQNSVLRKTSGKFHKLSAHEFGVVLNGFVEFEHPVPEDWLNQAVSHFETNLSSFQGHNLCYVIYCLVELGYVPSEVIIYNATYDINNDLPTIEYNNLAKFLRACGKAGYRPVSLLHNLEERLVKQVDRLHPKTASALTWSLATCNTHNSEVMNALAWGSYDKMSKMSPSQFSVYIWGLAKGEFRDQKFFTRAAKMAFQFANKFNRKELFLTFWAFAKAGRSAPQFFNVAMTRFPKEIPHYDIYQIANLAWALTKVKVKHRSEEVLDALNKSIQSKRKRFVVKGLANILYSFATLNYNPYSLHVIWKQLSTQGMEASDGWFTLGYILWAAFIFNSQPPNSILQATEKMIKEEAPVVLVVGELREPDPKGFQPRYLPLILYCLYALDLHDSAAAIACAHRINNTDVLEFLSNHSKTLLAQCLLLAETQAYESPLLAIPQHYKDTIKEQWMNECKNRIYIEETGLFKKVRSVMEWFQLNHHEKYILPEHHLMVDMLLKNPNPSLDSSDVALDLCEEQDYFTNTDKPNGKTLMRQKLLQAAGLTVIPVVDNQVSPDEQLLSPLAELGFRIDMEDVSKFNQAKIQEMDHEADLDWDNTYVAEYWDKECY